MQRHLEHYLGGRFAPFVRSHRLIGGNGSLLEAAQPPGDMSDPPVADFVLIELLNVSTRATVDFGAGRFFGQFAAGELFVVPPATATRILVEDPHSLRSLGIDAQFLRDNEPEDAAADLGWLHSTGFRHEPVRLLLDGLWKSQVVPDAASRLLHDQVLLLIMAELRRLSGRPRPLPVGGLSPRQLRLVTDAMAADLASAPSLADLARLAGLSTFHFARAFKRSLGMPPYHYLSQLRLERAEHLLRQGSLPIEAVAQAVGFGSSQAFARAFRSRYAVTPSAYRRNWKTEP